MLSENKFLRSFPAFLTLLLSGLPALNAGPAADLLREQAGPRDFSFAEPAPSRLENSPLSVPRAYWYEAKRVYSDSAFTPPKQKRLDTENSKLILLQGFHW